MAESQKECRVVNFAQQTTYNIPGPDGVWTSVKEAAICPATSTAIIDIPDSPQQDQEDEKKEKGKKEEEEDCDRAASRGCTTYMLKRVLLAATTVLLILATVAACVGFVATLHLAGYTIKAKTVEVKIEGYVRFRGGTQTCFKDWHLDCEYDGDIAGFVQLRFLKDEIPYPKTPWIHADPQDLDIHLSVRAEPENTGTYSCEMRFLPFPHLPSLPKRRAFTDIKADFSHCTTTTTSTTRATTTSRTTSRTTTTTSTLTEETTAEGIITPYAKIFGFLFGMFSLVVLLSVAMYYWRKNNKKNTVKSERAGTSSFLDPTSTKHARSRISNSHARSGTSTTDARSRSSTRLSQSRLSTRLSRSQSSTRNARSLTSSKSYDPSEMSRSHLSTTSYTSGTRMSSSQMSTNR